MVVPVDQRILEDQSLAKELFGSRNADRAVAPGPVGQNHRRKSPAVAEIGKIDIAAQLRAREKRNAGLLHARVDPAVLHLALLGAAARLRSFRTAADSAR